MNELNIDKLIKVIKEANEERVRITVEITPDEYGRVIQRIEIEPWEPYKPYCPYHDAFVKEEPKNG